MRRYTDEELRRLKEETDLAALVRAAGVELRQVGQDLRGRCPFHEDKGPSLVVTPAKNLWHCLGACGAGGSAIDWVMKTQGVSFRHAVELLRSRVAAEPLVPTGAKRTSVRRLPAPVALDADDRKLLSQVIDFYHATLKETREAVAYLEHRGLRSSEMVERFKLGYANRTLGYRLPERNRKAGAELRGRLVKLGIYRETGHEHFSGSLVIPILAPDGTVLGAYGRKIVPNLKPEIPKHLYLPGPHKGVWNVEALVASREIILCEALLDALTFWCAGYQNVTSSYGVHGFTDDHLEAFRKHGTQKILVAYDRDEAGEKAAAELAPRLAEAGIDVYRVLFPKGMDANEYARKVTPAAESLGVVLRAAQFVQKGKRTAPTAAATLEEPAVAPASGENASSLAAPPEPPPPAAAAAEAEGALRLAGEDVLFTAGDREYRVRGLGKNLSYEQLRLTIRVARQDKLHVDTFDLLSARQRALYVKQAALELSIKDEVVKKDLGKLLLELEIFQERRIKETLELKAKIVQLKEEEKSEALGLLRDPDLLGRIVRDFEKIGLVGAETNKLVGYLAATSRKMEEPLALLIQSNSAAGKSTLMDAILELMPEEDVERYTAMTGQSLYYMADSSLKHKVLAIAEAEGAARAGYAIKMLQSEGKISIATTVKDPETGDLKTKKHEVEGPVAVLLTTTAAQIDEELQNRAVVLTVNEDREQTRLIHERQRRAQTLPGMLAREERQAVVRLHRNAQRPVRQVEHQGRAIPYIEAALGDIEVANRLAAEVLGRSLDELAPQTRRLLLAADEMVTARAAALKIDRQDFRFSRRDLREWTKWGDTQLRTHLERLVELEYVLVHRGGRGQSFVYELLWDGQGKDGRPFLVGLLDPAALAREYDSEFAGETGGFAGSSRPHCGPVAGGSREVETAPNGPPEAVQARIHESAPATHVLAATPRNPVVPEGAAGG
jgi:DNA primase catalytic core